MSNYRSFIEKTLSEAAAIAVDMYGNVSSTVKPEDNNQVLTEADIAIGKLIVSKITEEYPDHNVIDEEAGCIDNGSRLTWVVDPIDGTSNFANGLPTYGIMIGLLDQDEPIAGGVVLPALHELYLAEKGKGATCNGEPITVTATSELGNVLVAYGIDGHQENPELTYAEGAKLTDLILQIRNLRTSNSCVDMMYTASGRYGGYVNKTSKIWDNVAPQIITEEAGGIYTDYYGQKIDYSDPLSKVNENFTSCAAPATLHGQIQDILRR